MVRHKLPSQKYKPTWVKCGNHYVLISFGAKGRGGGGVRMTNNIDISKQVYLDPHYKIQCVTTFPQLELSVNVFVKHVTVGMS